MVYTVTITRQGQISLPAKLRRLYKFQANQKLNLRPFGERQIIIQPAGDILALRGFFKTKKRFTKRQVREAFEEYLAHRHLR